MKSLSLALVISLFLVPSFARAADDDETGTPVIHHALDKAPEPQNRSEMVHKAGYGYCFKCEYSCGMKGMPPQYECSQTCGMGWYDNCD